MKPLRTARDRAAYRIFLRTTARLRAELEADKRQTGIWWWL